MDADLAADLDLVVATTGHGRYRALLAQGRHGYVEIIRRKAAAIRGEPYVEPGPGPSVRAPSPPAPVVDRFGTCVHLGPPLAGPDGRGVVRDCRTCSGSVRLKVFACRHPAHADTDAVRCRACPDYNPGGGSG